MSLPVRIEQSYFGGWHLDTPEWPIRLEGEIGMRFEMSKTCDGLELTWLFT